MVIQKKIWWGGVGGHLYGSFSVQLLERFFALRHSKLRSFALGVVLLASLGPKLAHFC